MSPSTSLLLLTAALAGCGSTTSDAGGTDAGTCTPQNAPTSLSFAEASAKANASNRTPGVSPLTCVACDTGTFVTVRVNEGGEQQASTYIFTAAHAPVATESLMGNCVWDNGCSGPFALQTVATGCTQLAVDRCPVVACP